MIEKEPLVKASKEILKKIKKFFLFLFYNIRGNWKKYTKNSFHYLLKLLPVLLVLMVFVVYFQLMIVSKDLKELTEQLKKTEDVFRAYEELSVPLSKNR
jgi:hypothetical protein